MEKVGRKNCFSSSQDMRNRPMKWLEGDLESLTEALLHVLHNYLLGFITTGCSDGH